MTQYLTGSRSCRAAAVGLVCVCAVVGQAGRLFAQEQLPDNPIHGSEAVVSDGASGPVMNDGASGPMISDGASGPMVGDGTSGPMVTDGGMAGGYNHGGMAPSHSNYGGYRCDSGYRCDGGCDDYASCESCAPYEPCCDEFHCSGWFGAELLFWNINGNRLPPLVTDGPATTPLANVARLDDPGTEILSGGGTENDDWRTGYRLFGGYWLDCCHNWGLGADYFDAGDDDYDFVSPQDPDRVVGRPFFNEELGVDDVELVSVPNELDGTADVRSNDEFKGAGVTINHSLWRCCDPCTGVSVGVSVQGGYRHYEYDSKLSITEDLTVLPGTTSPLVPGTTFLVQDSFRTHNEFDGAEFGVQAYKLRCWWWFDGMAKLAMGSQRRSVTVDGETDIDVPGGGTSEAAGGLLTSEVTNIGHYNDSDFVFIPELRLGIGAKVSKRCSLRAGYNCIIWGDVARASAHLPPGLEVDPRNLPPVQAGGGEEPEFPGIRGSQLVAHGLDGSIMWQW